MRKSDRLERALKEFRWGFIIASLIFIVLGTVMIFNTQLGTSIMTYTVGGALTLYGAFNVIGFLFAKERNLTFELVIGVLTAAIGIFILVSPDSILNMLQSILGLIIIIDSLLGIKRTFALRDLGVSKWGIMLLLSVATTVLGVLFMVKRGWFGDALMIVIGVVLLYQGISDLITVIRISIVGRRIKNDLGLVVRDEILMDVDDDD